MEFFAHVWKQCASSAHEKTTSRKKHRGHNVVGIQDLEIYRSQILLGVVIGKQDADTLYLLPLLCHNFFSSIITGYHVKA
jgi:hypothetical protein